MNPTKVTQIHSKALEAAAKKNYVKAHQLLMKIARLQVKNFIFNLQLAQVSFQAHQYSVAHKAVTRLERSDAPTKLSFYKDAFEIAKTLHRPQSAETFARMACKVDEDYGKSLLADLFERTHRLDEIEELGSSGAGLSLMRTKVLRRQGRLDAALELIQERLKAGFKGLELVETQHEFVMVLDARGEYQEAFEVLEESKKLLKSQPQAAAFRRINENAQVNQSLLRDAVSEQHYAEWAEEAQVMPSSKVALVTGFPRSGTTLIERLIDKHPDIDTIEESAALVHTVRESFAKQAKSASANTADAIAGVLSGIGGVPRRNMANEYKKALTDFYQDKAKAKILVDRNPLLTPLLPVYHAVLPNAPVVMIIRDPRDVCLSFYMQYLGLNEQSVMLTSLADVAACYMGVMKTWMKIRQFNSPQFLEVKYEEFVSDTEAVFANIIQHIGGEPINYDATPVGAGGADRIVMTPSYEAVTKPVYGSAIGRWKNYDKYFSEAEEILKPAIEAFGYSA
jgi:tetratricopeptide (TPR) repeat protein